MKKIALLLTLACSASFAADWRKVGETERGDVHIDAASIAQKGNIRQVLVMGNYKDAVETGGAENFSFKSYVDLSQYNCKAKTTAIVQEILYAEHDAKGADHQKAGHDVGVDVPIDRHVGPHGSLELARKLLIQRVEDDVFNRVQDE